MIGFWPFWILWAVTAGLAGCATAQGPLAVLAPMEEETKEPVQEKPAPVPANTVEDDVAKLLADAEFALSTDRLTSPIHDNAFDRFQAVLILQPNNPQAQSGLRKILLRYLVLARAAASQEEYGKARALLERARWVDKDDPDIEQFSREIAAASAAQKRNQPGSTVADNEYPLAKDQLDKQAVGVVDHLQEIARQARESGNSLLIVARSDAEGRWIYQQMKEAVPGFRLRGDIKLGREPKILLLPAID